MPCREGRRAVIRRAWVGVWSRADKRCPLPEPDPRPGYQTPLWTAGPSLQLDWTERIREQVYTPKSFTFSGPARSLQRCPPRETDLQPGSQTPLWPAGPSSQVDRTDRSISSEASLTTLPFSGPARRQLNFSPGHLPASLYRRQLIQRHLFFFGRILETGNSTSSRNPAKKSPENLHPKISA